MTTARRGRDPAIDLTPFFMVVTLLTLVGVAIWLAGWASDKQGAATARSGAAVEGDEAPEARVDPFADVPAEAFQGGAPWAERWRPGSEGPPEGLLASPLWQEASRLADEAWRAHDLALEARRQGDDAGYRAHGSRARDAFNKALVMTAEWELAITTEQGDLDPAVREVVRTRDQWLDRVHTYARTIGR